MNNMEGYNSRLSPIEEALNRGDWIYSTDGINVESTHGYFDKFKMMITYLFNPSVFGTNLDRALVGLFPQKIQPLLNAMVENEQRDKKRWFNQDSEWVLNPFSVLERGENEKLRLAKESVAENLENPDLSSVNRKHVVFEVASLAYGTLIESVKKEKLELIKQKKLLIEEAGPLITDDEKMMRELAKIYTFSGIFEHASDRLKKKKDFALDALRGSDYHAAQTIKFSDFKNDKEFVLDVIKDKKVLGFADFMANISPQLQSDPEIIGALRGRLLDDIKKNKNFDSKNIPPDLSSSPEIQTALKNRAEAYKEQQRKRLLDAIKKNKNFDFEDIPHDLRSDPEIVAAYEIRLTKRPK